MPERPSGKGKSSFFFDVIRNADWILDLGPDGGEEGGRIVAQGTPEQVAKVKKSYTGQALAEYFGRNGKAGAKAN